MTGTEELPTVDDTDNSMVLFSELRDGADRLLAEHTQRHERSTRKVAGALREP